MVGAAGFEPATLWSQTRCATRLRYAPTCWLADELHWQDISCKGEFHLVAIKLFQSANLDLSSQLADTETPLRIEAGFFLPVTRGGMTGINCFP